MTNDNFSNSKKRAFTKRTEWSEGCFSWTLLAEPNLNVKREKMAVSTFEKEHLHMNVDQFFLIEEGSAKFYCENKTRTLQKNDSIWIRRGTKHFIKNVGSDQLSFLLISTADPSMDRYESVIPI